MNGRRLTGVLVHGALLIVALGLAFRDWRTPAARRQASDTVSVWKVPADEIRSVRLETERTTVLLERRDDGGEHLWFRLERRTPPRPGTAAEAGAQTEGADSGGPEAEGRAPDGAADDDGATAEDAVPAGEPTVKEFLASERVDERLEKLADLRATRELGELAPAIAERLGLEPDPGRLTVTTGRATYTLELGQRDAGNRLRFARDPASGISYALEDSVLTDLEQADSRLLNRELHAFEPALVKRVDVEVGAHRASYVPVGEPEPGKAERAWAPAADPGAEDPRITTWLAKVDRLRTERFLAPGESPFKRPLGADPDTEPEPDQVESVLRIGYTLADGRTGVLDLTRYRRGEDLAYVAETEHTRGRVVVSRFLADEAVADLGDLFPAD